jgi:hypothetical protein
MTRRKRPTTTKKKGPYSTWRTSATVGTEMVRVHTRREDGRVLYTEVYLMNASGQKFRHSKYRPGFIDKVSDDTAAAVAQLRVYLRGGGTTALAIAHKRAITDNQILKAKAFGRQIKDSLFGKA